MFVREHPEGPMLRRGESNVEQNEGKNSSWAGSMTAPRTHYDLLMIQRINMAISAKIEKASSHMA